MNRNKRLLAGIVFLVMATSIISFAASAVFFHGLGYFNPRYVISFDSRVVNIDNIKKFNQVRNILKENYYQDVDENKILEGATAGLADSLGDPYTVYYNKEQFKSFMDISNKTEDTYVGLGIPVTLDNNGIVTVMEPFDDSPAKDAGITQGDKIIKVDGKDVTKLRDTKMVVDMIKGPENTRVIITVFRPAEGRTIDFDIVRKKIKAVINIRSAVLEDNIGYIKLILFDNEISRNFNKHLDKLISRGIKGLIIDLRDNPGGSYEEVISIADRLLPKGLIVYTEDKFKRRNSRYSDDYELGLPLVVLINGNSASASEILSGAVKDYKKGKLLGTKTFGKGLVQEVKGLDDGSGLKVTVARYFTPSGVCIQGIGIQPDIEIPADERYKNLPVSQIPIEEDVQLHKAMEVIKAETAYN